jgi:hypothetical protein
MLLGLGEEEAAAGGYRYLPVQTAGRQVSGGFRRREEDGA